MRTDERLIMDLTCCDSEFNMSMKLSMGFPMQKEEPSILHCGFFLES